VKIVISPIQIIGELNQFWRIPLYDFNIFTDKRISARYPDLVLIDRVDKCTYLIDIACAMDRNVGCKETEKIENYLDLSVEL